MITDMFGMPIKSGDSVVTEQFDLGVITEVLDQSVAQVFVNNATVPILFNSLCSVYPLRLEMGDISEHKLYDVINRELLCGSKVLYQTLSSDLEIGTITATNSSSYIQVRHGILGFVYRQPWELLVIDERIKYLEEQYPELLL